MLGVRKLMRCFLPLNCKDTPDFKLANGLLNEKHVET